MVDISRRAARRLRKGMSWVRTLSAVAVTTLLISPINPFVPSTSTQAATTGSGVCAQTVQSTSNVSVSTTGSGANTECIVSFTGGSNTWTAPAGVTSVEVLVVGGGGGGGSHVGGGGGGGGVTENLNYSVSPSTSYSVTVGAGGVGAYTSTTSTPSGADLATTGGSSTFGSITVLGGGHGASWSWQAAGTGANGGGGSGSSYPGGIGSSGFTGGAAFNGNVGADYYYATGGGAGANGNGGAGANNVSGDGGPGKLSAITGLYYGGGGGGGFHDNTSGNSIAGAGGLGGGGAGSGATSVKAASGIANTGGGGGGTGNPHGNLASDGGDGGSGLVLLSYVVPTFTVTWDTNGGSAVTSPSTFLAGTTISEPTAPTLSGKVFLGWSTSETSNQGDANNKISYWPYSATAANQTFHAIWADELMAYEPFTGNPGDNLVGTSPSGSSGFSSSWQLVTAQKQSGYGSFSNTYQSIPSLALPPNTGFVRPTSNSGVGGGGWSLYYSARELSTALEFDTDNTYYLSYELMMPAATNAGSAMVGFLSGLPSSANDSSPWSLFTGATYKNVDANQYLAIDFQPANRAVWVTGTSADNNVAARGTKALNDTLVTRANFVLVKIQTSASGNDQISTRVFAYNEKLPTTDNSISWDLTYSAAITGTAPFLSVQTEYTPVIDEVRLGYTYNAVTDARAEYTVTYQYNSATGGNSTASATAFDGLTSVTLPTPIRTGYTFSGWYSDSQLTNFVGNGGTAYSPTNNITLYANWTQNVCSPTSTSAAGYTTYTFTNSTACFWTVPSGVVSAEVLAVGAGGGGGWSWDNRGAGGGAGGQVKTSTVSLNTSALISIGQGGRGGIYGRSAGDSGGSTYIDSFVALGGGGGCGGSGTCANSGQPATANTAAYGGSGGVGGSAGKGGGGSNVSGSTTTSTTGGAGTSSTFTGSAVVYGSGGNGGVAGSNILGVAGAANTGNGGYGASARSSSGNFQDGGSGGSGILILRVASGYTATYNYNGATSGNTTSSDTYTIGGSALTLPTPSKTGQLFQGWFSDSALTTRVGLGGDSYTPSSSITLYAGWTNIVVNLDASKDGSLTSTPTSWVSVLPGYSSSSGTIANATYGTSSGIEYLSFSPTSASNVIFPAGTGAVSGAFTVEAWVNLGAMTSSQWNIIATRWFEASDWHFAIKKDSNNEYKLNLFTTGNNDLWGTTSFPSAGRDQWVQVGFTLDASGNLQFYVNGQPDGAAHTGVTHTAQAAAKLRIGDDRTSSHFGFSGKMSLFRIYNSALSTSELQTQFNTQALNLGYSALTVTFNANDSSGSPATSTQSFMSNTAQNLTANAFTRSGYIFTGWNTQANGSGTAYTNSQSVSFTANTTLYAQWQANSFTVTYNKNGATGSAERASDTFVPGSVALTLPTVATMTKTGYYFDGWATSVGGTKISGTYTPTANVTLYARWVASSYSITYDDNLATSGSPSLTTDTYTTGGSAITLATQATMVRTGYTFNGWSTTVNDVSTKITNSGSYTISSSVILYALWDAVDYTVTYSTQGSTSGVAPSDATAYNIGDVLAVRANAGGLVKTGYSFAGWTLNSDGSGTVYQSGSSYTFGAGNITLYPKWSANSYTITYNVNGATGTPSRTSDSYTTDGATISLPNVGTMVRTGYDFGGWSPSASGSALNNNGYTTTSNITLYAVWTLKSISYSYSYGQASGTNVSSAQVANFPSTTTQSGLYGSGFALSSNVSSPISVSGSSYQFMGWEYNNSIYSAGDTFTLSDTTASFTAIWVQLYEVRYGLNGGSGVTSADSECTQVGSTCLANQAITLHTAPTRAGYTFLGWMDQSGTTFAAGAATNVTASSYIFYAQWQAIDYTMTFNAVGGSTTPANLTKNFGDTFTLPSAGTKTGYTFTGWFDGTSFYGAGSSYVVGATGVGFIAQWTPNVYTVSYSWNGGVGTPTTDVSYTYGTTAITLPSGSSHTRDGYTFDGWALTAGGAGISSPFTPSADTILYARWVDGSYNMNFDAHGGTVSQSTTAVARGNSMTLPTPVRAGFTFDGWYEDSAKTVVAGRGNSSFTPASSRTLHAKWVQNSLAGIDPAHINSLTDITITGAHTWSGNHVASGTGASLNIPNGALASGTVVSVSYIEDLTRARDLIDTNYAYYSSLAVHWLTGTGDSATVPATAAGKPLTLTLTNPAILPGAKVFMIIDGVATEVATATLAGEVTIEISQDPEFVIAATNPSAPTSVTATAVSNSQSTVSWSAPSTTGGAAITDYTVTVTPGGATCTTTTTSCVISGLSDTTSYSYAVLASNVVGDSAVSSTTVSYVPPVVTPTPPANTSSTTPVVSSPTTPVAESTSSTAPSNSSPTASHGVIEVSEDGVQLIDPAPTEKTEDSTALPEQQSATDAAKSSPVSAALTPQLIVLIVTVSTLLLFVVLVVLFVRRRRRNS